ncbi:MAG TPA: hypothetical protein VFR35_03365 [Actinoplanes sp.]|nr:hypothetical protein [Actinoplanes sp.]
MSLRRRTRTELAGAWRSLRYDLGRRPEQPRDDGRATAPDVTCTGMSTFGGSAGTHGNTGYDEYGRPPRRLVAAGSFVMLAVVGAAGSYLAVAGGLGGLLRQESAVAGERPVAVAAPTGEADAGVASNSGLGRGPAVAPRGTTAVVVPPSDGVRPATTPLRAARPAQPRTRPAEPGKPAQEECDCPAPPVPTPTAPPPSSPTPSASGSPSPSPSQSEPAPSDSPSADPSGPHGN